MAMTPESVLNAFEVMFPLAKDMRNPCYKGPDAIGYMERDEYDNAYWQTHFVGFKSGLAYVLNKLPKLDEGVDIMCVAADGHNHQKYRVAYAALLQKIVRSIYDN